MKISDSDIARTSEWMIQAIPNPSSKNFHTQLGVHFEEIVEMVEQLDSDDPVTKLTLFAVQQSVRGLSTMLKQGDNLVRIKDRVEFLDGLCDQLVTATGVGHCARMDIVSGFGEVNRSNFSKFDDNGNPVLDDNQKIIKGPNYFKPNLKPFV